MLKKLYLIDPGCGKGYRTSLQSKDSLSLCAMMRYKLESLWGESQNNYKPQLKIAPIREKVTCTRDNLLTRNPLQQYFFLILTFFLLLFAFMLKKLYLIDPGCGKGYRTSLQSKDSLSLCAMMRYKLESLWGESQNNYKPQLKIAPIREKVTCTRDNLLTRNPLQQYFFYTNITFLQVLARKFQWRNRQVETC